MKSKGKHIPSIPLSVNELTLTHFPLASDTHTPLCQCGLKVPHRFKMLIENGV